MSDKPKGDKPKGDKPKSTISRRRFVEGAGAGLVAVEAIPALAQEKAKPAAAVVPSGSTAGSTAIQFTLNGAPRRMTVQDHWTLNEVLREHLELTGTKLGCDRSECGACTVLIDGKPMYSCTQLAAWMDGREIVTVEGLTKNDKLDPLQVAFITHDAPQCGYCTSGQLMSAKALLKANPHPTRDEVRHAMAGNICRCSNYNHYVEAVLAAAGTLEAGITKGDPA